MSAYDKLIAEVFEELHDQILEQHGILIERGFVPAQLEHSDVILTAHPPEDCLGEFCTLHNRSDHIMRSFPQYWRSDRGIMERICPDTGTGHPDPDDYRILMGTDDGTHGCDGCCWTDEVREQWAERARKYAAWVKETGEQEYRLDLERMDDEGFFI